MTSQEVYLMVDADKISPSVERAVKTNNPNKIAQMGQNLKRGDRLFRGWIEDHGGTVLLFHGDELYASIPGEHLSDLGKIHGELEEAWNDGVTIGVGLSLTEAKKALEAGKKRGGSRIVFYAPEIDSLLNEDEESKSDSHEAKTPSPDPEELKELSKASPSPQEMGIHAAKHASLSADRPGLSASGTDPYGAPQASVSGETPVTPSSTNMADGLPSAAAPGPSATEAQFHTAAQGGEAEAARSEAEARTAQAAPEGPSMEEIKKKIVQILQKVKQQAPVLEQLKDQAPDAYKAIVASIQAMIMMAKAIEPQGQEQQGQEQVVAKSEALQTEVLKFEELVKSARETRALRSIVLNDQATPEQLEQAKKLMSENLLDLDRGILHDYGANPKADKNFLLDLAMRPDLPYRTASTLFNSTKADPKLVWSKFKEAMNSSATQPDGTPAPEVKKEKDKLKQRYSYLIDDALLSRPFLPPEVIEEMYHAFPMEGVRSALLDRLDAPKSIIDHASKLPKYSAQVTKSPHLDPKRHAKMLKDSTKVYTDMRKKLNEGEYFGYTEQSKFDLAHRRVKQLLMHHLMPLDKAKEIANSMSGMQEVLARDVDATHTYNGHTHPLVVKPGLHKIRQIRDLIEGRGGEMTPQDLTKPVVQFLNGIGRLPNGNFSSKAIQEHIDKQPGIPIHASTSQWSDGQQHSGESSKVFRVSLPTEITEKLLKLGVSTKSGHKGSHPGEPISGLGWVRWTGDKKGVHIDEVQHDFGLPEQKAIESVLGHPINRVLTDAFHEEMRQPRGRGKGTLPTIGTPVHIWTAQSKAPLSGQDTDQVLPAHMQSTYDQNPAKMGMQPGTYGMLPTQKNAGLKGKPTHQDVFRKSVKEIREAALAKAYVAAEPLQPKATGIDNQIKVHNDIYPTNKEELEPHEAPPPDSVLSKIRKNLRKKATGDAVTGAPEGLEVTAGLRKEALPMPEATNKVHPTPSGAQVERLRGDATPQAHKYTHVEPGQAAHVSMDGKPQGPKVIRQAQSGQALPNEQRGEADVGVHHPTSAKDPADGHPSQGNQQG